MQQGKRARAQALVGHRPPSSPRLRSFLFLLYPADFVSYVLLANCTRTNVSLSLLLLSTFFSLFPSAPDFFYATRARLTLAFFSPLYSATAEFLPYFRFDRAKRILFRSFPFFFFEEVKCRERERAFVYFYDFVDVRF